MKKYYVFFVFIIVGLQTSIGKTNSEEVEDGPVLENWSETYIPSPINFSLEFSYSPMMLQNYNWFQDATTVSGSSGSGGGISSPKKTFQGGGVSAEWLPIVGSGGKLGFGLSTGYLFVNNMKIPSLPSPVSVYFIPLSIFTSYHFDYLENQFLVPYVRLGLGTAFLRQTSQSGVRDTVSGPSDYLAYTYGIGFEFRLNNFDNATAQRFEATSGVNNSYLFWEYMGWNTMYAKKADLQSNGFRMGLRFEI